MNNPPDLNELRVRVAELCGWKSVEVYEWRDGLRVPEQFHFHNGVPQNLPDFPRDLNACAEFEKWLEEKATRDVLERYAQNLCLVAVGYWSTQMPFEHAYKVGRATAEQRCRAFIATMEATSVRERNELQPVALDEKREILGEPGGAK